VADPIRPTIYKYSLRITDVQSVKAPRGTRWLSAQMQNGRLCVWATVDPNQPDESHLIRIIGTGNPFPAAAQSGMVFVGTVQDAPFVWHVFAPEAPDA
jgi:hypothetical protein